MRSRDPLCAAIDAKERKGIGGHFTEPQVDRQDHIRLRKEAFGIGGHANTRLTHEKRVGIVKKIMIAKACDHRNIQLTGTGL